MASSARWWSHDSRCHEIGETIIWCVERREFGNRATPIRDDHFFASLHPLDVLAQPVLQVPDPDLRPRCSYKLA